MSDTTKLPAGKRWPITSVESQVYIDTGELPAAQVCKCGHGREWHSVDGTHCRECHIIDGDCLHMFELARTLDGDGGE